MSKKLIAAYGTLKKGYHNNQFLKNSKLLGEFKTDPSYTMCSNGGYPIVKRDGETPIHCEIWEVSEKDLPGVYMLEGYTGTPGDKDNWYDVDVIKTPFGKAEIFVMDKHNYPTLPIVNSGKW